MGITNLTDENFNEQIESGKAIVYFYDNKKKSSRIFEEIMIETEKDIGKQVKICKMNVSEEKTKVKLGVMSLPTMVYFKSGKVDRKIVGIRQKEEIITMLK